MATTAATYYQWSKDKPCTTNQTYGYSFKEYADAKAREPAKPKGPFDHTRPFSNAGFFPHISKADGSGSLTLSRRTGSMATRHKGAHCPPSVVSKFNINYGYVVGPVPVQEKIAQMRAGTLPGMMRPGKGLSRSVSAPASFHRGPASTSAKDAYLWHTLSGTLVHVKSRTGDEQDAY